MDQASTTSADLHAHHLEQFRAMFPHFVKDGEIDFDALQAFLKHDGTLAGPEKYSLSWAGKSNAFNLIRRPATGTLVPSEKESKHWDSTKNIFIEGDNLEVLKLLQKHYRNSIKMIYIDPPYNTGKDFIYSDNFTESVSDYYERTGQSAGGVKLTSNPESNGRYHSDWLTMMYPRLFLGRNLLRDDGVIFVSIDDNEVHNLRLIMDEIFGEENFVSQLIVIKSKNGLGDKKGFATNQDYILVYQKTPLAEFYGQKFSLDDIKQYDKRDKWGIYKIDGLFRKKGEASARGDRPSMFYPLYFNPKTGEVGLSKFENSEEVTPIRDNGSEGRWIWGKERAEKNLNQLHAGKNGTIYLKNYLIDGQRKKTKSLLDKPSFLNEKGTNEIKEIFDIKIFDTVKPVELIKLLIENITYDTNNIILDFFAGSGTTAHAVMDLNAEDGGNRRWISVQLPELTDGASEAKKAGFNTIADISRERIRRAGDKIGKGDIGFKSFTLSPSSYRRWRDIPAEDTDALIAQTNLFNQKPLVDGYHEQSVVYELLVKEGFDLNAKATQKQLGGLGVWHVTDGERQMIVSFAPTLRKEQIEALGLGEHDTLVCFDSALDDTTKVNAGRSLKIKVM